MASEREKKETELGRNRFFNVGQRRKLHAVEAQVEKERLKVKTRNTFFSPTKLNSFCREKNVIMPYDVYGPIF
jgi:hypothetical protein